MFPALDPRAAGGVAGELVALDGQAFRRALAKLEHLETVEKNGGRLETRRYWHPDEVEWFARAVRGHWGLDVPPGEEASRVRRGHAPENLATSQRGR